MKRIFLTSVLIYCFAMLSHAQVNTDSLWKAYQNMGLSDSLRIDAIENMYYTVSRTDLDSALTLALEAKRYAVEKKDSSSEAYALFNEGYVLGELRKYEEAIARYKQAVKIQKQRKNWRSVGNAYSNMGYIYMRMGETDLATRAYQNTRRTGEAIKDTMMLYRAYNQLALIADNTGAKREALDHYFRAMKLAKDQDNKQAMSVFLLNAATIYSTMGNSERENAFLDRAYVLKKETGDLNGATKVRLNMLADWIGEKKYEEVEQELGALREQCANGACHPTVIAGVNITRAQLASFRKQNDTAVYYYSLALDTLQYYSELESASRAAGNLGTVLNNSNRPNEALKYGRLALEVGERVNHSTGIQLGCLVLYQAYARLGRKAEAFDYYKRYIEVRDTLESVSDAKDAEWKALEFEYNQKQVADSLATEQEKAEQKLAFDQKIERQRWYTYGGGAIAVLMLIVAFVSLRSYQQKKKAALDLEEKNEVISHQKALVEEKQKEVMDSINYAQRIQAAILPPSEMLTEHLKDGFVLYLPKDVVAGDFYWMEHIGDWVFFAAADCTGHGVPGAMVSVVCNNALNQAVREYGLRTPAQILDKTRELVVAQFEKSSDEVKDGMDISLCGLNKTTGALTWAGANNPLWIVRQGLEEMEEIKATKQAVGQVYEPIPFAHHEVQVSDGDTIYLFSDGFIDQFGGDNGKKYKSRKFKQFLLTIQDRSMNEQKEALEREFNSWKGSLEQLDDICVIGVKIVGSYS